MTISHGTYWLATAIVGGMAVLLVGAHTLADQATPAPRLTACGKVEKVRCDSKASRVTTLELKPKSKAPITILPASRAQFTPSPEELYRDTEICATGVVETDGRHRRVVVSGPQDIAIRKQLKPAPPPWTGVYFRDCDEGLEMPVLVHDEKPNYTRSAMEARIVGIVALEGIVTVDGAIGELRVRRSLDSKHGLDDEAIRTVRLWRFKPGTRMGEPVPVLVAIEISFQLK
jgi:TonB family protein